VLHQLDQADRLIADEMLAEDGDESCTGTERGTSGHTRPAHSYNSKFLRPRTVLDDSGDLAHRNEMDEGDGWCHRRKRPLIVTLTDRRLQSSAARAIQFL